MLEPDSRNREKLASFHQKCLRRVVSIGWNSYNSNEVVLERVDEEDPTKQLEEEDGDTWDRLSV